MRSPTRWWQEARRCKCGRRFMPAHKSQVLFDIHPPPEGRGFPQRDGHARPQQIPVSERHRARGIASFDAGPTSRIVSRLDETRTRHGGALGASRRADSVSPAGEISTVSMRCASMGRVYRSPPMPRYLPAVNDGASTGLSR